MKWDTEDSLHLELRTDTNVTTVIHPGLEMLTLRLEMELGSLGPPSQSAHAGLPAMRRLVSEYCVTRAEEDLSLRWWLLRTLAQTRPGPSSTHSGCPWTTAMPTGQELAVSIYLSVISQKATGN